MKYSFLFSVSSALLLLSGNGSAAVWNRVSSFYSCSQIDPDCNTDEVSVAEILDATPDGMTVAYTDGKQETLGFINIKDPSNPIGLGTVDLGGEPTSVVFTKDGKYALTCVNTSTNYTDVSGVMIVISVDTQDIVTSIPLGGQPDSIAVSQDNKYAVICIENERNEDEAVNGGLNPQLPAGYVVIVDKSNVDPTQWTTTNVDVTGLVGDRYPTDPEPEFVDINKDNIAVISLQENNAFVLIDVATANVVTSFSAGEVSVSGIDTIFDSVIDQTVSFTSRTREPDAIAWITTEYFLSANEGDSDGGTRGFSIFKTDGSVVYDSGNILERILARHGHYPEHRSGKKGGEPEGATTFEISGERFAVILSERGSVAFLYDVTDVQKPVFQQLLPTLTSPEGVKAIVSRGLLIVACEVDKRKAGIRGGVVIYALQEGNVPDYPSITSANITGTDRPIPFSALSGLASADPAGFPLGSHTIAKSKILFSTEDSYYKKTRIFQIDANSYPAVITNAFRIVDTNGVLANAFPSSQFPDFNLVNDDKTVNLDAEGIALSYRGGYWIANEGAGTVNESKITSNNFILYVTGDGTIQQVIKIPQALTDIQYRYGLEGIAEQGDKLYVCFQRAWGTEANPRIGIYDTITTAWEFVYYPLETPKSQYGGWVGLSDISPLGGNRFLVLERDNRGGPDAAIKSIYLIDLTNYVPNQTIIKQLFLDLIPELKKSNGHIFEKVEGLAVNSLGNVWFNNDNDGVNDNSGEQRLFDLGNLAFIPFSPPTLQLLHSSDNESSFVDSNTLEDKILFYSSIVKGLQLFAANNGWQSIHVTVGDHTLPGPYFLASAEVQKYGFNGLADIDIYNAFPNLANGMGNHEFDDGINTFARNLDAANYPFLAANLDFTTVTVADGAPLIKIGPDAGPCETVAGQVVKSCYITTPTIRVGLIGRAPADFFVVISNPTTTIPGLDFVGGRNSTTNQPNVSAIGQVLDQVDKLQAIGINVIILLDHAQDFTSDPLSTKDLRGIDIIAAAGATGFYAGTTQGPFNFLRPGDVGTAKYPVERVDSEGNKVLAINSDQLYKYVGQLIITFTADGKIKEWDARSGPIATTAQAVGLLSTELKVSTIEPNPQVKAALDALKATPVIVKAFEVIGTTKSELNGARAFIRTRDTNLGQLTADSTLWGGNDYASKNSIAPIDIALKNGGGIRDTILGPNIVRLSIQTALAFNNKQALIQLTASQLIAAMENSASRIPAVDGRFPQIAGMVMTVDTSKPGLQGLNVTVTPSRVKNLVVTRNNGTIDTVVSNFKPQGDLQRTFNLATNDFLIGGGDGYNAFTNTTSLGLTNVGEQEILENYIKTVLNGKVDQIDPPTNPRVVIVTADTPTAAPKTNAPVPTAPVPKPTAPVPKPTAPVPKPTAPVSAPTAAPSKVATKQPSKSPVAAPTKRPCFSGDSSIAVKGKGIIPMSDLKIGDSVLTGGHKYSTVYGFAHYAPEQDHEVLEIHATGMVKSLEISPLHMLFVNGELQPAANVKIGDFLVGDDGNNTQVQAVRSVIGKGIYAPLTTSGELAVNNVVTSCYVALPALDGVAFQRQALIQHVAVAPYRFLCTVTDCSNESYDAETGLSQAVRMWYPVLNFLERNNVLRSSVLWILSNLTTIAICVFGYYVYSKNQTNVAVTGKALKA